MHWSLLFNIGFLHIEFFFQISLPDSELLKITPLVSAFFTDHQRIFMLQNDMVVSVKGKKRSKIH